MSTMRIYEARDERLYRPILGIYGISNEEMDVIKSVSEETWDRCLFGFKYIKDPRYSSDGVCPYHAGQYMSYLYFLGNTIYKRFLLNGENNADAQNICDKIFMTSLTISGADIYYAHEMPDIFLPVHPLGAVLTGKAKIGNYFFFMQGCNIGINKGIGPILGDGIVMWGNAKIVGNCKVGNHVMFGANSYIKDMDIPDNSVVYGQYPNVIIKENREDEIMSVLNERFYID